MRSGGCRLGGGGGAHVTTEAGATDGALEAVCQIIATYRAVAKDVHRRVGHQDCRPRHASSEGGMAPPGRETWPKQERSQPCGRVPGTPSSSPSTTTTRTATPETTSSGRTAARATAGSRCAASVRRSPNTAVATEPVGSEMIAPPRTRTGSVVASWHLLGRRCGKSGCGCALSCRRLARPRLVRG